MILWSIAIVMVLLAIWVVGVRGWLKAKPWPWSVKLFAWLDPIEVMLWQKSETILWARFKMVVGILLTILTAIGSIDLSPIMPLVPEKYRPLVQVAINLLPMTLTMVGMVDERLRRETTKPLELVAISDKDLQQPEIAKAVGKAQSIKESAVAVVEAVQEKEQEKEAT